MLGAAARCVQQDQLRGGLRHPAAGGGRRGELGGGLVQLHPRQDAHRVQPRHARQEPHQPRQHPRPGEP